MLAVIPFYAFAAVDLTVSNVVEYPTATDIYSGQAAKDSVLSGGRVEYNGVEVPGHFEHVDPEDPIYLKRYNIKFVPDDTSAYNGFTIEKCKKVSVTISPTVPVIVGDLPTASSINYGEPLRNSIVTFNGKLVNPHNENDPKLEEFTYEWEILDTVPEQSGYFPLRIRPKYSASGWYKVITQDVWVEVIPPEIPLAEIITYPTIDEFTYNENYKWGDFELKGGEANVPGKFEISDAWKDVKPETSPIGPEVIFTPDDQTVAQPVAFRLPVKVKKADPYLISEDGSGIPTIKVPYMTEMTINQLYGLLMAYVPEDIGVQQMQMKDMDNNELPYADQRLDVGLHELEFKLIPKNSACYNTKMVRFNLLVEPKKLDAAIEHSSGKLIIRMPVKTEATFNIYLNDELVLEKVKASTLFEVEQKKSGPYVLKAVYNGEDNRFVIPDIIYDKGYVALKWRFSATGLERSVLYEYGAEVVHTAPPTDISKPDKPYYGFTNWEVVSGNPNLTDEQLQNAEVRFIMPDENVELKANYKFSFKLFFDWLIAEITEFFVQLRSTVKAVIEALAKKYG
ncbi:MAG: hypothetical protein ACI4IX_06100 [Acutalibacteraceae bacterium]